MTFARSRSAASSLLWLDRTASTNDELRRRALASPEEWPHLSVLATADQTAGRGRLGRVWVAPPGRTLAASVLLDARGLPSGAVGWLPLVGGAAVARAVRGLLPAGADVAVKWPNDVLVDGRKLCGLLAERIDDGRVVLGIGVNLTLTEAELPVSSATSLALAGAGETAADTDAVLAALLVELDALLAPLLSAGGDADASGTRAAVIAVCGTLGQRVSVQLPDGDGVEGEAVGIDSAGRLVVDVAGEHRAFTAGDVTHLRGARP